MLREANEAVAEILIKEAALEDKKQFVENLGWLLSQTRQGTLSCELKKVSDYVEYVVITYRSGAQKKVNVSMYSYTGIIRAVIELFS